MFIAGGGERKRVSPVSQRIRAMNSSMDRRLHHDCVQRAIALGRGADSSVLPELLELNKTIETKSGTFVQSEGERLIADYLTREGIAYRYDERFRILDGYAIRPDFYLPEFDVYIEYWGMDTADYKIGMLKKQKLYQQEGKRVISIYPEDKPTLDQVMQHKLGRYLKTSGTDGHEQDGRG